MSASVDKIKTSFTNAPLGALCGAVVGYFVSKKAGYDKTLPVISFIMVGALIGSAIGNSANKK